ncbi:MAG: DUF899 family protein [Candidatus Zixiibacteriota bacterium]|nr:MAG: DUF899 family protein [candidate division Zixibacteria bacterium]
MKLSTAIKIENKINSLEKEIFEKKRLLAELKRNQPRDEVTDYLLTNSEGEIVRLSEMFGCHDELMVIHNMGKDCPYCTLWADGFNGIVHHLENRAGFALVSPDRPETVKEFASRRNWRFKLYSGKGSDFIRDMGFEDEKGDYWPGVSSFIKENGRIYRAARDFFGPHDNYCSAWHLFDLLPRGAGDWQPKFEYQA